MLREIRYVVQYYKLGFEEVRRMPVYIRHWMIREAQQDILNSQKSQERDGQWGVDMDTPLSEVMNLDK